MLKLGVRQMSHLYVGIYTNARSMGNKQELEVTVPTG